MNNTRVTVVALMMFAVFVCSIPVALYAHHPLLVVLSGILTIVMLFGVSLIRDDFFSPLPMFSVIFFGYVLGGYYYAFSVDSFGKFVDFTDLVPEQTVLLMELGLSFAIVCYTFIAGGYLLAQAIFKRSPIFTPEDTNKGFIGFYSRYYGYVVPLLLIFGGGSWVYISYQIAGGVWNAILLFQVFPHLIADAGLSTLPYQFYFAGIYLWLLGIQVSGKKIGMMFVFFSLLGCLICLTTGRIMLALTYLLAQVFFIALANEHLKKRMLIFFVSIMSLGFVIYFLRIMSNYFFLGQDANLFENGLFQEFFFRIIGSGNVADLQQLAIIFYAFDINDAMLGSTYLDTLRNSIGVYLGFEPSSVGLILKESFFPASSGAPTPGAIGEAYVNFNFAAPMVMLVVGFLFYVIHHLAFKSNNYIVLFVYAMFLVRFVFMYAKVDSTMMVSFLWGVTPMLLCIFGMFLIYRVAKLAHIQDAQKNVMEKV